MILADDGGQRGMAPWRRWTGGLVLAGTAGLYALAGLSLSLSADGVPWADPRAAAAVPRPMPVPPAPPEVVPEPEPLDFRNMDLDEARAWNASVPVSDLPNPAARAFRLAFASEADRVRATECLTAAIYYEAAIEPTEGQRAVAQVVLNRVRHPAYPASVCGVVFEGAERRTGCQFTFTCDGSLARAPHPALWRKAQGIAAAAIAGEVYAPVGWATHYHTDWVVPYWAQNLVKAANVGTHIFYRWTGGWGRPAAFATGFAGVEPTPAKMRSLTSAPAADALAETLADAPGPAVEVDPAVVATGATVEIDGRSRAVVRRYVPLEKDSARALIADRSRDTGQTASQRWALTGGAPDAEQAPLGAGPPPDSSANIVR